MRIPYNMIAKISTLTVYSYKPFTEKELNFLNALNYSVNQFNQINTENAIFCLYLGNGNFLVGDKTAHKAINPLIFVNQKGEISFEADIKIFDKEVDEFQNYINYVQTRTQNKNLPYTKQLIKAIRDYKNDFLDFKVNKNVVPEKTIAEARNFYNSLSDFDRN